MSPATEPPEERGTPEERVQQAQPHPEPTETGAERLAGFAAALAGFTPSHGDSAGQPWEGREFDDNPFGDDDGSAPTELLGALAAFRAGEVGPEAVVDAVRSVRLLIPLLGYELHEPLPIRDSLINACGGLFALIVAFSAAGIWNDAVSARNAVQREADALENAMVLSASLPAEPRSAVGDNLRAYLRDVIAIDWPAMARSTPA